MPSTYIAGKKVIENKGVPSPRFSPFKALPFGSLFRAKCCDCGRETSEGIGRLVNERKTASLSAEELAKTMTCARAGCGGEMEGDIDLPE